MSATAPTVGARPRLRPLRSLLPYLAPYKAQFALALAFLLLAAGATLAAPLAVRQLVDTGFAAHLTDPAARLAALRGEFLLLFAIAAGSLGVVS